jgi:hypothetical protein
MATKSSYYDPAKYRNGTLVRIMSKPALDAFRANWKLHHPLQPEQIAYAGHEAKVSKSGMYHGGDVLYELEAVSGIWHEQCLEAV